MTTYVRKNFTYFIPIEQLSFRIRLLGIQLNILTHCRLNLEGRVWYTMQFYTKSSWKCEKVAPYPDSFSLFYLLIQFL